MQRAYLSKLADRISKRLLRVANLNPQAIRDECDLASGSELDCTQLDILTSMVESRLVRASFGRFEPSDS
jgi:hypothetical protein